MGSLHLLKGPAFQAAAPVAVLTTASDLPPSANWSEKAPLGEASVWPLTKGPVGVQLLTVMGEGG
jgi:hypothetical protein